MADLPGAKAALSACDLTVGYGNREVVSSVNIQVGRGELVAVAGPNGSGKSTLLKTWLGILRPLAGEASVLGAVPGSPRFRKTRMKIGYVAQNTRRGALPVTVREAVAMGRYGLAGLGRRLSGSDWKPVEAALRLVGLHAETGRRVEELSGGQIQRVAIARALAMEPEVLFLDEPLNHLDSASRHELIALIQDIHLHDYVTIILVSHVEEAFASCSAIYRFEQGSVRREPMPECIDG